MACGGNGSSRVGTQQVFAALSCDQLVTTRSAGRRLPAQLAWRAATTAHRTPGRQQALACSCGCSTLTSALAQCVLQWQRLSRATTAQPPTAEALGCQEMAHTVAASVRALLRANKGAWRCVAHAVGRPLGCLRLLGRVSHCLAHAVGHGSVARLPLFAWSAGKPSTAPNVRVHSSSRRFAVSPRLQAPWAVSGMYYIRCRASLKTRCVHTSSRL